MPTNSPSGFDAIQRGDVPVLDLSSARSGNPADREALAAQLGRACESLGFLVVTGHGVESEKVNAVLATARRFFESADEDKRRAMPPSPYVFRGFFPIQSSALAASLDVETPPDLCEVFAVNRFDDPSCAEAAGVSEGREGFFAPNIWPEVDGFRDAWTVYYGAMETLANELMALMALALGLDEDWFEDKIGQHISNLVVNHYPAQEQAPADGQIRRGAHTDYGSLTVLYQDDNPGGLQVELNDGSWADVPHLPGSFVVNLGDLMAAWTNGRWASTMHRGINPEPGVQPTSRMSVAFFHQPDYDAEIRCIPTCTNVDQPPRHEPVTSGEWVLDKLSKSVS